MNRLIEVKQLIKEKNSQIQDLSMEIYSLEKERLELETGFKEGDLVENRKGERGILVKGGYCGWSWRKLKKNNIPSDRATYLGYDNIKKVEQEVTK
jgi:hypothetical protein